MDYLLLDFYIFRRRRIEEKLPSPIFEGEPLNIFKVTDQKPISFLKTWDAAAKRELEFSCESLPRNAFDEKIMWTNEGKLWSFPIDNEVGELFISI